MNTQTAIAKANIQAFFNRPSVQITSQVLVGLGIGIVGAFIGYRSGRKAGDSQGQVKGYACALEEIGVAPAEVPELASAWAVTKAESAKAMDQAMAVA